MLQWFISGEYVTAKEIREIGEEYLGACTWHLPIQDIARTLNNNGFKVESRQAVA